MKKYQVLLIALMIVAMFAAVGCSADVTVKDPSKNDNISNDGGSVPSSGSSGDIHIDVDFDLNINVEDGKDADGFTWEHNFSEITITGYIGSSNELTIPKTINGKPVTQIKKGAMKNFTGLKSVVIPGSVKTIEGVFEGCTGLQTVAIAEQGLENMEGAFKGCTALQTVNVPTTVTEMESAFSGCIALKSEITVPAGVTSLNHTFAGCTSLKKVVMHDGVEDLLYSFSGCIELTDVNVSKGAKELHGTFRACAALANVQIPEGVNVLNGTFAGCSSLRVIEIPAGVTTLEATFVNCTALESVVIADSVCTLSETFTGCTALTTVEIPENATSIYNAFQNCTSLQSIHIPAGVTIMGAAFLNCTALENVSFAGDRYELNDGYGETMPIFNGCTSLKKLELPAGIGLRGYGCIALEELIIHVVGDEDDYVMDQNGENPTLWVYISQYVSIENLPAMKKLDFVCDTEGVDIYIDGVYSNEEVSYTVFDGAAGWREDLMAEAQTAKQYNSYRYYAETLDDGTEIRRISEFRHGTSVWDELVEVTEIESRARVGCQIIYTLYVPALIGEDLTPGIVLYKVVETEYVSCGRPEHNEDVCGTETYADCEYNESITINGVSYSIEVYEYEESEE